MASLWRLILPHCSSPPGRQFQEVIDYCDTPIQKAAPSIPINVSCKSEVNPVGKGYSESF